MNSFEKFESYCKDNPEGYWFKRRLYGWGWTPVKWQGWLVVVLYLILVETIFFSVIFDESPSTQEVVFRFALPFVFLTVALIVICYRKGEKPKWTWGPPKEKVNDETGKAGTDSEHKEDNGGR